MEIAVGRQDRGSFRDRSVLCLAVGQRISQMIETSIFLFASKYKLILKNWLWNLDRSWNIVRDPRVPVTQLAQHWRFAPLPYTTDIFFHPPSQLQTHPELKYQGGNLWYVYYGHLPLINCVAQNLIKWECFPAIPLL